MKTVILTGGKSSRMGSDKAQLPVCSGRSLACTLADRFSVFGPVVFSVDEKDRFPSGAYPQAEDRFPGLGPLNGIFAAFSAPDHEDAALLMATDMPYASPALALQLAHRLTKNDDACVIRRRDGRPEPLFAIYRSSCLGAALECMRAQRRSLRAMLAGCSVRYVAEDELPGWDLDRLLFNMNTPTDYDCYLRGAQQTFRAAGA